MCSKNAIVGWCLLEIFINLVESNLILTSTGYVKGRLQESLISNYYSYQGIPYAEPPVGNLRFKPPTPKTPWQGVLNATKEGPVCPQPEGNYYRSQMSEDCLFLNIYAPKNKTTTLPVLVYVSGGEFTSLSGNSDIIYGPSLLVDREIIFVTMNYRLGALGFFSLNEEEASGNMGIKDVILALKWINENIISFGGNPDRITLGGNSAGAILVHYLMLTIKTSGLFHRTILFSGSALGYRFLALHAKENSLALSRELGIYATDAQDIVMKLREIDPFDIVAAQVSLGTNDTRKGYRPFAPFVPCVEINSEHSVITKHPIDIVKDGMPQNVPVLTGFNSDEGVKMLPAVTKDPSTLDNLNNNFELLIPSNIEYPYGSSESLELAESIRNLYLNNNNISTNNIGYYLKLVRETQFTYSIDYWINNHKLKNDSNKVYYYVFNFDGDLNWFKIKNNIDYPGTSHGDEEGYLFETNVTKEKLHQLDSKSERMLDIMLTFVSNFVKYGNPNEKDDDTNVKKNPVFWPEYTEQEKYHMLLSETPQVITNLPIGRYLDFWYEKYNQYYDYLQSGGKIEAKIVP